MLAGDLKNLPFNDVLQVLANGQKTGVLALTKGTFQAHLYLNHGRLEHAHLAPGLHLGELLVKMDLLTSFEVQSLLARQTQADAGTPLGVLAVETELLTLPDLKRALKAQILDVLAELSTWRSGRFSFGEQPLGAAHLPNTDGFDTIFLLMEVAGRLDLWQQGSAAPDSVFERVGDPTHASLLESSWDVLACVDGKRTARSIAAELDLPGREVYYLLHQLQTEGVIAPARYPGEALNALVLSSSQQVQRLIALSLQRANLTSHSAETSASGLEFIAGHRPNVIVVDDHQGEGWDFVRVLRSLSGRSHLPVVMLCDTAPRGGLFSFRRPKAYVLQKPFHELELQQLVTQVVARRLS